MADASDTNMHHDLYVIDFNTPALSLSSQRIEMRATGPSSPDSVSVGGGPKKGGAPEASTFFSAGAERSPRRRFVHSFVTLISRRFAPGFNASVTSTRNGAF